MSKQLSIVNLQEYCFHDRPGGVARLVEDLILRQVKWGFDAHMVSLAPEGVAPGSESMNGYTLHRIQDTRYKSPDPRNLLGKIMGARHAIKGLDDEVGGIDILHTHIPSLGLGAMLGAGDKTFKVHSVHSPWLLEIKHQNMWSGGGGLKIKAALAMARLIEHGCFKRADLLTSFSEYTRSEVFKSYPDIAAGVPDFEHLSGWADMDRFTMAGDRADWSEVLGRPAKSPVFFTLRGLAVRNGLDMLIEAAAIMRDRGHDCEVVIAGGGPLREKLDSMVRDLYLSDRVTLLGRVSDEMAPVLYRSCDVFVLPTMALECFGLITLEALASGKPVIATPVAAIPEIMNQYYPAGLIKDTTADSLAKAMIEHIQAPGHRLPGSADPQEIREKIEGFYSSAAGTDRFKAQYERGLAKKKE